MVKKERSARLQQVRERLGLSQTAMADILGIGQSAYSHMERGVKSGLTIDHLSTIVEQVHANPYYLLYGQTPMFTDEQALPSTLDDRTTLCYLVPTSAQAGYAEGLNQDATELPKVVLPGITGYEAQVFEIEGDSMIPVILDGDFVACTKVDHPNSIKDGLLYVVVSQRSGITLKYLQVYRDKLRCIPRNTSDYKPFDLSLDDVREIWEVRMRLTRHVQNDQYFVDAPGQKLELDVLRELLLQVVDARSSTP